MPTTNKHVNSEEPATYHAGNRPNTSKKDDDAIIGKAIAILDSRINRDQFAIKSPTDSADYLRLKLSDRKSEVFCVLWLDNRHRVLAFDEMFQGTIDGASVHPREVVRRALEHNAAAAIFAHNHPSGVAEPSHADRTITQTLRDALDMVQTRVLDHFVIGDSEPVSMAERGLI